MTQELVNTFLKKGFLLSPDVLDSLKTIKLDEFNEKINKISKGPIILNNDLFLLIKAGESLVDVNWVEFEKSRTLLEKGRDEGMYHVFLDLMNYNISEEKKAMLNQVLENVKKPENLPLEEYKDDSSTSVVVMKAYEENENKKTVETFVQHYKARYNSLKRILQHRTELQNATSISRILNKTNREQVSIIGLIVDKQITKKGNILITLEDLSGKIKVLINQNKGELYELGKDLVLDECVGINGVTGDKIVFANNVLLPDVPHGKEIKKCDEEVYVSFIADFHYGSSYFLKDDLLKFIKWINGELGSSEQRQMAKKVKYLFIGGDLVAGVGIYPGQEADLDVSDIYEQYKGIANYLSMIRKDIKIIICPGNHDSLRIAEPQPVLNKKYAAALWELPNVIMVTNPSLVNIHSSSNFEGFNVLMYHGYSFDYYGDNVEGIRIARPNISERAELIIKYLLQKRHLSPTHTATLFVPTEHEDPLVIDKVPDFFVCAHIHKASVGQYKHVTNVCCSCWQSRIPFQVRVGHIPEESRAVVVNLKTRETKIMKFCD